MTRRMPWSRDQRNPRQHFCFAFDQVPLGSREIDAIRNRVSGLTDLLVLGSLRNKRYSGEKRVVAAVIEVEVRIDHHPYVTSQYPDIGQGVVDGVVDRAEHSVDVYLTLSHSGVNQHRTLSVMDDETEHLASRPRSRVIFGQDHLTQKHGADHQPQPISPGGRRQPSMFTHRSGYESNTSSTTEQSPTSGDDVEASTPSSRSASIAPMAAINSGQAALRPSVTGLPFP